MSFFADPESLEAFMKHLDADSPWHRVFSDIRTRFGKDNPRKPVAMWAGIDPDKRLTAHEALAHKWFADV